MNDAEFERIRSATSYLNPNCDRQTWVKYGMCLKAEFGDAGFDIWDQWSANSDKYSASGARSTWKSIKADGKRTVASLIFDAKQAGWKDDGKVKRPTAAELAARKEAAALRAAKAAEEDAIRHAEAAKRARALWDEAKPVTGDDHPYLQRKGVAAYGLRVGRWERFDEQSGQWVTTTRNGLLIPIGDRTRAIWGLQCIYPEPGGRKLYLKDCAKFGHFHVIGSPVRVDGRPVFVLVEGYATGASIHAATGHAVLVCFDASNLGTVARSVRERLPDAVIVLGADNDTEVDGNPGVTAARAAALSVAGHLAVPPIEPGDFNDLQVAEGLEAVAGVIAAALSSAPVAPPPAAPEPVAAAPAPTPAPTPADAPAAPAATAPAPVLAPAAMPTDASDPDLLLKATGFTILGYDGDSYYLFHHGKKQVLRRGRSDFSDQGLVELADLNWWEEFFPGQRGGVNRVTAFEWFVKVAHARGIYDVRRVRGRGAWGDRGRVVFHHGGYLSVDGKATEIAAIDSGWVYPMAQSLRAPAADPATDADGKHLLDVVKMARWTRPGSAALLAGWVFLSPVCGALPWRPHVWLTGASGSGKSTIQSNFVQALLAGICEHFQGDSSEPGIRQSLGADAIPVLIDEFEPNDEADRKRMKNILTMIRQASSETAAQTVKGTLSGDGIRYHVRSMFCLASINTMLDKDSDQTRITPLVLRPPARAGSAGDQWSKLEEELHKIERDGRWPARLLARSLGMLPTIVANVDVFCRAAAKHFGTQRLGDQYGTLLAGAWSLQSSVVASEADALQMISSYDWTEHQDVSSGLTDPEKALAAILDSKLRVGSVDVTMYEVMAEACGRPSSQTQIGQSACVDILRRNGMILEGGSILFGVASNNLRALVKDTPYSTDLRGQLSRLSGATNYGNKTRRFSGSVSKIITVPLSLVMGPDEEPPI